MEIIMNFFIFNMMKKMAQILGIELKIICSRVIKIKFLNYNIREKKIEFIIFFKFEFIYLNKIYVL